MDRWTKTPVVILALNLPVQSAELYAIEAAGLERQMLKKVLGAYKGQTERAYVFDVGQSGPNFGEVDTAKLRACIGLAEAYGQDSVLFLSYAREAQLIYCNSRDVETLGQWTAVPESVAIKQDNWTRDAGQYYIVREA